MSDKKPMEIVNGWLSSLNSGKSDLTLNEEGLCDILDKNNNICKLCVIESSNLFKLHLSVVSVNDFQDKEPVLKVALGMNLHCEKFLGGSLAFNMQSNEVMFCFSRAIGDTNEVIFQNILFYCFDLVEHLISEFRFSDAKVSFGGKVADNVN